MNSPNTVLRTIAAAVFAAPMLVAAGGPDTYRNGESFYGQPAAQTAGEKVVDVTRAKHVNVEYGDTVTFINEEKQFSWTFDGVDRVGVELEKIAPPDFGAPSLTIYVGSDMFRRN